MIPEQGEKISNGSLNPAFSGAKKRVKLLRNPAFLGIPKQGDNTRSGCLTPTFSGGAKRERNCYVTTVCSVVPKEGGKMGSGSLTAALRGAQKRAEVIQNPGIDEDPRKRAEQ